MALPYRVTALVWTSVMDASGDAPDLTHLWASTGEFALGLDMVNQGLTAWPQMAL